MWEFHNKSSPQILCQQCGIFVRDSRSFKNHLTKDHSLKCPECPLAFAKEEKLLAHRRSHVNEIYRCQECDLDFEKMIDCIIHRRDERHTPHLECFKCDFVSNSQYKMELHVGKHQSRLVHACQICEKKFFSKALYEKHLEIHSGIKKYSCVYCPKKFVTNYKLSAHTLLNHHREVYGFERFYDCKECGRSFKFETSLRRHLNKIHNVGPNRCVTCKVCSRKLASTYGLKLHMRQHTGEKIDVCDICGKGFTVYKTYKQHVLVHHPEIKPVPKNEPKTLPLQKNKMQIEFVDVSHSTGGDVIINK